ncbi:RCC1/BLIP-II protein [Basidiobolus meristosporus CBS 931.73]|uniref:RCC1/BLIP-II protein n=1 Tax=Basidiobolus meristosporus CBS 931.73 TaxID=1314790 RepID=A0A1Y1VRS7_9FUNG|nr:RCC1/BLIP-II protein [Basidiobolus meristosporus CBS 931.73]|eukprot:ORX64002.1 RCC1/BLIP-II protein [Basidiobolus meristosporus CBS 931.73]
MVTLLLLPQEVLEGIVDYLSIAELTNLGLACRELHTLVENETLWKQRCYTDFNISPTQTFRLLGWKTLYKALINPSIFTWGDPGQGRLGREVDLYNTGPRMVESMNGKGVVQIACGGWSMTALTKQGEVWTWGTMNPEATLHTNADDFDVDSITTPADFYRALQTGPGFIHEEPVQVEGLRGKKVKAIASGRAHSLALTDNGQVYQWRTLNKVRHINLPCVSKIVQIAAGWSHSLALAKDGRVYSWHSTTPSVIFEGEVANDPTKQEQEQYVMIGGGEAFTIALTNLGRIYKSTSEENLSRLCLFDGASGRKFTHISSAFRRFAAFNEDGKVAIWDGSGNEEVYPELQDCGVNQVTFGDWHFGALTNDGKLYTWGQASGGALGQGSMHREVKCPTQVPSLAGYYIFSISFAGWHSAALAVPLKQKEPSTSTIAKSFWKWIQQFGI